MPTINITVQNVADNGEVFRSTAGTVVNTNVWTAVNLPVQCRYNTYSITFRSSPYIIFRNVDIPIDKEQIASAYLKLRISQRSVAAGYPATLKIQPDSRKTIPVPANAAAVISPANVLSGYPYTIYKTGIPDVANFTSKPSYTNVETIDVKPIVKKLIEINGAYDGGANNDIAFYFNSSASGTPISVYFSMYPKGWEAYATSNYWTNQGQIGGPALEITYYIQQAKTVYIYE